MSNYKSRSIPRKNIIEKVSFDRIKKQRVISDDKIYSQGSFGRETDYIIDNSRDITSYHNQQLKGIVGNALRVYPVFNSRIKRTKSNDEFLNGPNLFQLLFWFKTSKRKKGFTQKFTYHNGVFMKKLLVEPIIPFLDFR